MDEGIAEAYSTAYDTEGLPVTSTVSQLFLLCTRRHRGPHLRKEKPSFDLPSATSAFLSVLD